MKPSVLFLICFLLGEMMAQSQSYPWPVGTTPELTANFGELRSNHYHMGLDGRTERRENLDIYSIEEGYVSRVKIEPWGYGRSIYIDHPNGITTVYAHLNDFYPELEAWVRARQYEAESWKIDLTVPAGLFPVKRKQFIAYSGNTGGSMGPHLHFEMRNTQSEVVLNPLKHGFHISDKTPPDILRLAVYDRNISTYEQTPRYIPLVKTAGGYTAQDVVVQSNRISFGFTSYDRYTGSTNQNGIYGAALFVNNVEQCRFTMDSIHYSHTRYLNAHIDYKTKLGGGPYIQHLSLLPGHHHHIYSGGDGILKLQDNAWQDVKIIVYDPVGNLSVVRFKVRGSAASSTQKKMGEPVFHPNVLNIFENENVRFYLPEKALYDSFQFKYNVLSTPTGLVHQLHNGTVPVHEFFNVQIRNVSFPKPEKVVMHYYFGTKKKYAPTRYKDGWYTAPFRELGNFKLIYDTISPVISAVSNTPSRLSFTITDNAEDLTNFRATLNGQWILVSFDKGKNFVYKKDDRCKKGLNTLEIYVEDMAGNASSRTFTFNH